MDTTTNPFRIAKARMPAALVLLGGQRIHGDLFVQAGGQALTYVEGAPEFLNSADAFFPVRIDSGVTLLVSKSHVLTVEVERQYASSAEQAYGDMTNVEIAMEGGPVLRGEIRLEAYNGHARVLDYINRSADHFLLLRRAEDVALLNRRHIVYIKPFDNGAA
jgi:hypothetical protein